MPKEGVYLAAGLWHCRRDPHRLSDGRTARNYLAQPLRGVLLPALALAIEACFGCSPSDGTRSVARLATCAEYALLAAFVALNFRRRGAKLLALATALNFAPSSRATAFPCRSRPSSTTIPPWQFDSTGLKRARYPNTRWSAGMRRCGSWAIRFLCSADWPAQAIC